MTRKKRKIENVFLNSLELTASEPLSEEEEYEMQTSWREDEDSELLEFFLLESQNFLLSSVEILFLANINKKKL